MTKLNQHRLEKENDVVPSSKLRIESGPVVSARTGGALMSDDQDGSHRDPPRSHRFKSGQSGNPRGRPRGTRNLSTDLTQLLKKRIRIREDGETRHISRQEAILLSLYSKAVRGDVRAIMSILTMLMKLEPATASKPDQDEVSQRDQEIIEDYLRRKAAIQAQNKEPTISGAAQDDVSQKDQEIVEDLSQCETERSRRTFDSTGDRPE